MERGVLVALAVGVALSAAAGGMGVHAAVADGSDGGCTCVSFGNQLTDGPTVTVGPVTLPSGGFVAVRVAGSEGGAGVTDDGAVTVDAATLHGGGFLAVRRPRDEVDEPSVGHSAYLAPGTHADVRVPVDASVEGRLVVVAHRDDGDRRFDGRNDTDYLAAGEPVPLTVDYRRETGTTTPRTTTPRSESANETTTVDGAGTTTESGGVPGFAAVAAVVSLLAVALAGRRPR